MNAPERIVPDEATIAASINSAERLDSLRRTGLLDTPPEECFDRLTRLAAKLIGVQATFISLVDQSRDFYKSSYGFGEPLASQRQLEGLTLCHYTILSDGPLVLKDASATPVFRDVPTVESLGVKAYVGIPLVTEDGQTIGSFCAIDFTPREWTDQDIEILTELAHSTLREIKLSAALKEVKGVNDLLEVKILEINAVNQHLECLATTDPLTGLSNRRVFKNRLQAEMAAVARRPSPLSVALVDADNFKRVNDRLGHVAGDAVLQAIASLLTLSAREIDLVARIGGEEFAIILPGTDRAGALQAAERFRAGVADAVWPEMPVTVSIGIATLMENEDAEQLVKRADVALYLSKDQGRNRTTQA